MEPVFEKTFNAAELMSSHPPRFQERNKRVVFEVACPPGSTQGGAIVFARYRQSSLPIFVAQKSNTMFEPSGEVFNYKTTPLSEEAVEWHLNFAHSDLFCAYGGKAFAQDEIQVMEHPVLAALREALLMTSPGQLKTVENGEPTPVVIMGAERRCEIATAPNAAVGRPNGIYGRLFSIAGTEVVRTATHPIVPPTASNVLAIEAPANGSGRYTMSQIELILRTAYSGFRAAHVESDRRNEGPKRRVVIHTGFWGCGVYGNDRVLMVILQLLAARLAGIDQLVFHAVGEDGAAAYERGLSILEDKIFAGGFLRRLVRLLPANQNLAEVLRRINDMGFRWGAGDGN